MPAVAVFRDLEEAEVHQGAPHLGVHLDLHQVILDVLPQNGLLGEDRVIVKREDFLEALHGKVEV